MSVPTTCPNCGAAASGRFCSACGSALAGASCANCAAPLTVGAHFCHRCGTPAGATAPTARGLSGGLPWAVAAIALVALIALVVGQRFGSRTPAPSIAGEPIAAPAATGAPAGAMPRAPDISQMTPEQQAERLYDRIMREYEAGQIDNVKTFMPMAVAAYERLAPLNSDQRYDLARVAEVGGDLPLAHAQADTILRTKPTHLLGLILSARLARLEKNEAKAKAFDTQLLAAQQKELATGVAEYLLHKADIDAAVSAARSPSTSP
ncbi:MAG: zinc ribbon domain-containing protein [Gemmatimonadaceae bacterium]